MDVLVLTTFLAPCLPFLLEKVGAPALNSAAEKLGEDTWETAKAIWSKLRPKVESEAAAKVAAEKLANKPNSAAWTEALQEELERILEKDKALEEAIASILQDVQNTESGNRIQQTIKENKGQVIGQMFGGKAQNISGINSVQGDVNL